MLADQTPKARRSPSGRASRHKPTEKRRSISAAGRSRHAICCPQVRAGRRVSCCWMRISTALIKSTRRRPMRLPLAVSPIGYVGDLGPITSPSCAARGAQRRPRRAGRTAAASAYGAGFFVDNMSRRLGLNYRAAMSELQVRSRLRSRRFRHGDDSGAFAGGLARSFRPRLRPECGILPCAMRQAVGSRLAARARVSALFRPARAGGGGLDRAACPADARRTRQDRRTGFRSWRTSSSATSRTSAVEDEPAVGPAGRSSFRAAAAASRWFNARAPAAAGRAQHPAGGGRCRSRATRWRSWLAFSA